MSSEAFLDRIMKVGRSQIVDLVQFLSQGLGRRAQKVGSSRRRFLNAGLGAGRLVSLGLQWPMWYRPDRAGSSISPKSPGFSWISRMVSLPFSRLWTILSRPLRKIRNDILVRTLAADILSSLIENEVKLTKTVTWKDLIQLVVSDDLHEFRRWGNFFSLNLLK